MVPDSQTDTVVSVGRIAPFDATPHLLLRVNLTPAVPLRSAHADQDALRLAEMAAVRAEQDRAAPGLTDLLYDTAGQVGRELRHKVVLPLRRAVHNRRLPKGLDRGTVRATVPEALAWFDRQVRLEELRAGVTDGHADALREERAGLRSLLEGEHLRRSLAVSSEFLPAAADKYKSVVWEEAKKSVRKSEEPLLRYAMRAGTKTSPFSLYTVAGFLDRSAVPGGRLEVSSTVEANRGLLRRLEARLSRLPVTRERMYFHVSPGLRLEEGRFIATGNRERLGEEAAVITERYGEAKVTVPANPAAMALLDWLRDRERGRATFAEMVEVIARNVRSVDRRKATDFVSRLCDIGVLAAEPVIDDMTPDVLRELHAWLAPSAGDAAVDSLRGELARLCTSQDAFPSADPHRRVELIRKGREHRDRALGALGDDTSRRPAPEPIWFEDGRVNASAVTGAEDWKPILQDCGRLLSVLQVFDEQHVFSRVLTHRFTRRFGQGGQCDDLDALGEVFIPAYEDALRITEGFDHELAHNDPVLSRLVPLRSEIVGDVARQLHGPGATGGPAELDPAWARYVDEHAPQWVPDSPASYGVFLQPLGGSPPTGAVLNKIYNGWGNYISRFLTGADPRIVEGVRDRICEYQPSGDVVGEIRAVQGFNANIHPLLGEVDIDWDERGEPGTLPLSRLRVRHDPLTDRILLWDPASGRRVHPLYLGFLIPYYLPSRLLPLTAMGGSGSIFFEPQVSADRSATVDRSGVRHYSGIRFGSLWLARERWHVRSGLFPRPTAGEPEADYFLRLCEWRTEQGIPEHVFVHPPAPELHPGQVDDYFGSYMDNRKPQYVNTLSRLHVRHLNRLLADQPGADIVIEEALPGPDEHFPLAEGRHAVELVAEFYRKAAR
ncbi:lantibiotic dehydratase [Nocardiopsis sp. NPDC006832]|uniref:lantibiotic dehydratase n=1 Tax=Nocardiopsis sp. NPDC006832 TaxID=3157188 RepID=UPI0033FA8662